MLMSLGNVRTTGSGLRGASLQSLLPSCVYDLDATMAESYSGSGGTWRNLAPDPADGSARSAYDFSIVGSASRFKGAAGTPAAHWLLDGATHFDLPVNTPYIRDIAKTGVAGNAYTLALAFRFVSSGITQWLYSMASNNLQVGLTLRTNASGLVYFRQNNNDAAAPQVLGSTLADQTDYLVIASRSVAGDTTRMWVNGALFTNGNSSFVCADDALMTPNIAAAGSGSSPGPAGGRIYAASLFNKELGADDVQKIMRAYALRHRRRYA